MIRFGRAWRIRKTIIGSMPILAGFCPSFSVILLKFHGIRSNLLICLAQIWVPMDPQGHTLKRMDVMGTQSDPSCGWIGTPRNPRQPWLGWTVSLPDVTVCHKWKVYLLYPAFVGWLGLAKELRPWSGRHVVRRDLLPLITLQEIKGVPLGPDMAWWSTSRCFFCSWHGLL